MKINKEIKKEARATMKNGWFGRLFVVGLALYAISYGVQGLLGALFAHYGVNASSIPAVLLQLFLSYIFGGILAFGIAKAMLKAVDDRREGWFVDSFGGFQRPFEVCWLLVYMNLRICLWTLLLIIPGIIAVYRYRQAWYIKSEKPELSAHQCLKGSGVMMKGHKWQAFWLDCSFIGWFFLASLVLGFGIGCSVSVSQGSAAYIGAIGALLMLVFCWLIAYLAVYFMLARTIFYRETKEEAGC